MNSLLEFFTIVLTDPISNVLKQLLLGSSGGYYDMSEARVFASFHHILAPGFGDNLASVLNFLTNPEKWEGLYGTGDL